MKKLILSVSIIALAVTTTNAQVSFGAKAGLNLATFTGSDASSTNLPGKAMKAGLNVGAIVNIPVSGGFSIEPGVYYSMEGVKVDGGTYDLSYINIPALAKYTFAHGGKGKASNGGGGFSIATGPQLGLLTSAKVKPTGGTSTDIKDLLNSTDFAWALALAYTTSMRLGFEAKYNMGIGTIDKGTPKDKFTNSVLQFNVFYMFGGNK